MICPTACASGGRHAPVAVLIKVTAERLRSASRVFLVSQNRQREQGFPAPPHTANTSQDRSSIGRRTLDTDCGGRNFAGAIFTTIEMHKKGAQLSAHTTCDSCGELSQLALLLPAGGAAAENFEPSPPALLLPMLFRALCEALECLLGRCLDRHSILHPCA